jgi:hypothetical protein
MAISVDRSVQPEVAGAYARLEEKILERDQRASSQIFYDLVRAGRPLHELLGEIVRIHAPYTHVPYHQRLDDGIVRFVNNDHCLLSSRASMDLMKMIRPELAYLPLAQTIWYLPTGPRRVSRRIIRGCTSIRPWHPAHTNCAQSRRVLPLTRSRISQSLLTRKRSKTSSSKLALW